MNKKAMLLAEETLKMIIALIGISVLVYLLFSIYFASVGGQKTQHAIATIERMSEIIGNSESLVENVTDPSPIGWYLFGFVGEEKKPNSCSGQNCLCICDNVIDLFDRQIKQCDNKGACVVVENLQDFEETKIERGFAIEIVKEEGEVIIK